METKAGYRTQILGIHYDKDGNIKRIDVRGMSLEEVIGELMKRKERQKERLVLLDSLTQTQRKYYEEMHEETINWKNLTLAAIKDIIDELKDLKKIETRDIKIS